MDGIPHLIRTMHMFSNGGNKMFAMDDSYVSGMLDGNWDFSRLCMGDHPS